MMPKLWMSALLSYTLDLITSGATKAGVPATVPVIIFPSLDIPTPAILTTFWSDICTGVQKVKNIGLLKNTGQTLISHFLIHDRVQIRNSISTAIL